MEPPPELVAAAESSSGVGKPFWPPDGILNRKYA
jgi:hypothetical protein